MDITYNRITYSELFLRGLKIDKDLTNSVKSTDHKSADDEDPPVSWNIGKSAILTSLGQLSSPVSPFPQWCGGPLLRHH